MPRVTALAAALGLALAIPSGQAQQLSFDTASVRPNTSGAFGFRATTQGRTYSATNFPLHRLIATAFGLGGMLSRLTGVPAWVENERFDITATLPANATPRDVPALLRALLAERFQLVVRSEMRSAPAFALVVARSDGRLGPRLLRATVDCAAEQASGRSTQRPECQTQVDSNIQGRGQPLSTLARLLPSFTQRPVVDRTGLTGGFDFDITIPPQSTAAGTDTGGGIFTALQEQLGLKLESIEAPLEFIVIERIERPAAN